MSAQLLPTTSEIQEVFVTVVADHGGTVTDEFDDGNVLFLRSTLPQTDEVRHRDVVQRGVALRTTKTSVSVHPYVFRQVCRNGAIWARTTDTRLIERADFAAPPDQIDAVVEDIREAVTEFAYGSSFRQAVDEMREAAHTGASIDLILQMLPIADVGDSLIAHLLMHIGQNFDDGRDQSLFGLMNAVTSVARDTRDPEQRWRLEELGGAVPALLRPRIKPSSTAVDVRAVTGFLRM